LRTLTSLFSIYNNLFSMIILQFLMFVFGKKPLLNRLWFDSKVHIFKLMKRRDILSIKLKPLVFSLLSKFLFTFSHFTIDCISENFEFAPWTSFFAQLSPFGTKNIFQSFLGRGERVVARFQLRERKLSFGKI